MHITARSYLTAGVAVVGAGTIALSPIQPLPGQLTAAPERAAESLAVNLASSIDPITPWVDTFKTSIDNIKQLAAFYANQPLPLLNTIGANIGTYFDELTNGNAGLIPGQIQNNIQTFFQAPWWNAEGTPIPNGVFSSSYISSTQTVSRLGVLINSQSGVYNAAAPIIASQYEGDLVRTLLEFTATPYSGQLIGLLSPVLSGVVQLTRSFTAVGQFFQDGDLTGAINELINIPANVTNAALNGAGALDLTAIAQNILPPALASLIQAIGVNLGGALSPAVPFNGSLTNASRPPTVYTGGTLFDIVSARATVAGIGAQTTGLPVGWFGSVIGLGQFLGQQMLVTPPTLGTAATAPAAVGPKVAAALPAPAASLSADAPAAPAAPVVDPAPVAPAVTAPAAEPPVGAAVSEVAAETPAVAVDAPARAQRGGGGIGNSDGDSGHSARRGHRGAADNNRGR